MDIVFAVISLIFVAYIVWREHLAFLERRDLTDRLMARSLPEYKDNLTPEPNHLDTEPTDIIDLEEGKEDLNGFSEAN